MTYYDALHEMCRGEREIEKRNCGTSLAAHLIDLPPGAWTLWCISWSAFLMIAFCEDSVSQRGKRIQTALFFFLMRASQKNFRQFTKIGTL
jgi:hypothetical protein